MGVDNRLTDWIRQKYRNEPLAVGFVLAFCSLLLIFLVAGFLTHGQTFRAALFPDSHDTFMDFFNSVMYSSDYPYHKYHVIYPPFITFLYAIIGFPTISKLYPFFNTDSNFIEGDVGFQLRNSQLGLMVFFAYTLLALLVTYELNKRLLSKHIRYSATISLLILLSFPVLYAVERGNCIILIIPLITLFLLWYNSENTYKRCAAFLCLGLAASVKIYVVWFLLLFIRERRFKDLILCILPILFFFFVPFLLTDGSVFNWYMNSFGYVGGAGGEGSFISAYMIANFFDGNARIVYLLLLAVIYGLVTIVTIFSRDMKKWKLFTLISCAVTLGVGTGATYNLAFYCIGFLFFLCEEKEMTKKNAFVLTLFLLIFSWIPAFIDRDHIYEFHTIPVLLLFCLIAFDGLYELKHKSYVEKPARTNKQYSGRAIAVYLVAMVAIMCSLLAPVLEEGHHFGITNNGSNLMDKIENGETVNFTYDPDHNRMQIGEDIQYWFKVKGLNILNTERGFLSNDLLMYLDSTDNRISKTVSGLINGTVGAGTVHLESNGWTADWTYDEFAFLFTGKGDYSYFSNSLPTWRVFVENEPVLYSTFYSDVGDAIISVEGSIAYSDGHVQSEPVTYVKYDTDVGFGQTKYIWNEKGSVTVSLPGNQSDSAPAYIVKAKIDAVHDVSQAEWKFITLFECILLTYLAISLIILRSRRIP